MKDCFCSYYTNSEDITKYMVSKLDIVDHDIILEPSAGEGIFIDEILNSNKTVLIDALDINRDAIAVLSKKYNGNPSVVVRETDTLLDKQLDLFGSEIGHYTKVIGNPPYGAWQDYEKRDLLKKKYTGHYVKETYSLFLLRCISVLKMHGRLSFIIPDTYLFLNMHTRLRELIFSNTKIDEILIFPSKFFPGVSFGYSNLSIITLERSDRISALNNTFSVIKGFSSSSEFGALIEDGKKIPKNLKILKFKQSEILKNDNFKLFLGEQQISRLLSNSQKRLGDVADIVTGFYTGDNLRFIKVSNKEIKGSKAYDVVDYTKVFQCTSLYGIPDIQEGYIPYIKSGSRRRYVRQDDEWFVRWDKATISFYNQNKKTRFQNSSFYFKTGIGIPMVKSSIIRAFLMEKHVFDQSIVGIFPKDYSKIYYLLALMNSDTINNLIHVINPTANNSSNYVKQLPYIEPNSVILNEVNKMVKDIILLEQKSEYEESDRLHCEINTIIKQIYSKKLRCPQL